MNPAKVERSSIHRLTDLPNVGPAIANDLRRIGISVPGQLVGKDPYVLYKKLCRQKGSRQDPCVLDVFISVTRFMNGEVARPWWEYTGERKRLYGSVLRKE
jgi:hypothetical protein